MKSLQRGGIELPNCRQFLPQANVPNDALLFIVRRDQPSILWTNTAHFDHVTLIDLIIVAMFLHKEDVGRNTILALFVESIDMLPRESLSHLPKPHCTLSLRYVLMGSNRVLHGGE